MEFCVSLIVIDKVENQKTGFPTDSQQKFPGRVLQLIDIIIMKEQERTIFSSKGYFEDLAWPLKFMLVLIRSRLKS